MTLAVYSQLYHSKLRLFKVYWRKSKCDIEIGRKRNREKETLAEIQVEEQKKIISTSEHISVWGEVCFFSFSSDIEGKKCAWMLQKYKTDTERVRYDWYLWRESRRSKWNQSPCASMFIVISISQWTAAGRREREVKRQRKEKRRGLGWQLHLILNLKLLFLRDEAEHPSTLTVWPSDFYFRSNKIQRVSQCTPAE